MGDYIGNSLFSAKKSIWTYNCPCPSPPEHHRRHVCRFESSPAWSIESDTELKEQLISQYDDLRILFSQRSTPLLVVTPPPPELELVAKQEELALEPLPKPSSYTTYNQFRLYLESQGLTLRARQCRHADHCFTKDCTFAHSVPQMLELFKDERVIRFYCESANIRSRRYAPLAKKNGLIQVADESYFCCGALDCKSKNSVSTSVITYSLSDNLLFYPYLLIRCDCGTVSNGPIYS